MKKMIAVLAVGGLLAASIPQIPVAAAEIPAFLAGGDKRPDSCPHRVGGTFEGYFPAPGGEGAGGIHRDLH